MELTNLKNSPRYPEANGAADGAVDLLKNLIKRSKTRGNISADSLPRGKYWVAKHSREYGLSPAEMIYGRPMRSHVSHIIERSSQNGRSKQRGKQEGGKSMGKGYGVTHYLGQCVHPVANIDIGTIIHEHHPVSKRWSEVVEVVDQDQRWRSYIVNLEGEKCFGEIFDFCDYFAAHDPQRTCSDTRSCA